MKSQYPGLLGVSVDFYGAGDSFDDFSDVLFEGVAPPNPLTFVEDHEDLFFHALEQSDANFNNDGSSGTVRIDLGDTLSVDVTVEHNVMSQVSGDGYYAEFELGGFDNATLEDVTKL